MARLDRWHLCECGLLFPHGLPIVARLLVWPSIAVVVLLIAERSDGWNLVVMALTVLPVVAMCGHVTRSWSSRRSAVLQYNTTIGGCLRVFA